MSVPTYPQTLLNQLRYLNYNSPWGTGPAYSNNTGFIVGNVGIGTTNPQGPLGFSGSVGEKIVFSSTGVNSYGIGLSNNTILFHSDSNTSKINFGYGSSETFSNLMTIDPNNGSGPFVGIGTNNPIQTLDVIGPVKSNNVITASTNTTTTLPTAGYYNLGVLTNNSTGPARFKISIIGDSGYAVGSTNNYGGECVIYGSFLDNANQSSTNINGSWYLENSLNNLFVKAVKFTQVGSNRYSYNLCVLFQNEKCYQGVYLLSTNNVSFTPNFVLISDPGTDTPTVQTAPAKFSILNANVGLGTNNPSTLLTVNGNASIGNTPILTFTPGSYYNGSGNTSDVNAIGLDLPSTGKIVFSDNVNVNTGKIGIGLGTSNPIAPLSFPNTLGDKIHFNKLIEPYPSYGFGVQTNKLQIFAPSSIDFGYGSATNFTQTASFSLGSGFGIFTNVYLNLLYLPNYTAITSFLTDGTTVFPYIPRTNTNQTLMNTNNGLIIYLDYLGDIFTVAIFGEDYTITFIYNVFFYNTLTIGNIVSIDSKLNVYSTGSEMMNLNGYNAFIQLTNTVYTWYVFIQIEAYTISSNTSGINIGVFLQNGGTSWFGLSDRRLKTDIVPIENNLEKILGINPVYFRFKTDLDDPKMPSRRVGFIAQDVQDVLPEAVSIAYEEDFPNGILGIAYNDIIPICVGGIKELVERNNSIKNRIQNVQNNISTIKQNFSNINSKLDSILSHLAITV